MVDWNPESYARFRDLRLRPALDLLAQVGGLPNGCVVDLACGNGMLSLALRQRWPDRRLIGVDASPAMLEDARRTGRYDELTEMDVAAWNAAGPTALIFSNAGLHWLSDHAVLLPRLSAMLASGGTLAVQMPRQYGAPSHRFLRDFAADMFPDRFDFSHWQPPVAAPVTYHRMLAPLGTVSVWETDYVQRLEPTPGAHPVRRFTEATAMRPFVEKLSPHEAVEFINRYDAALASAYPFEEDGAVLFPFRRLFLTLERKD